MRNELVNDAMNNSIFIVEASFLFSVHVNEKAGEFKICKSKYYEFIYK